jgi:membrane protein DedA with SNARE-associated domain
MTPEFPAIYLALFLAPFLHEDVAIVAAAVLVVHHGVSGTAAAASVYAGVLASDLAIYGLGAAARNIPGLRNILVGSRAEAMRSRLDGALMRSVALCHLLPGMLFPTFVACGWLGLPFARFAAASALAGAVYVPLALLVIVALGETVLRAVGWWSWSAVLAIAAVVAFRGSLRRVLAGLSFGRARAPRPRGALEAVRPVTHRGMPSLGRLARRVARAERIPPLLFYAPYALRWFRLAARYRSLTLPTVADPGLPAGGLWGESKSVLMREIAPEHGRYVAAFTTYRCEGAPDADVERAVGAMVAAALGFPVVAKPDIGWQGYGVRLVESRAELWSYCARFPAGETVLLQQPIDYDGEAGVYYARRPGEPAGRVIGLGLRYFPHVVGDGGSTVRELIAADARTSFKAHFHLGATRQHLGLHAGALDRVPTPGEVVRLAFVGSLRVGGLYCDGYAHVTPALEARFDAIARSMREFWFGRFDVRFASIASLEAGEDFAIVQVNGAGAEPTQVWDPEWSLAAAYRELFRYQSVMFEIAAANRARGYRPMRLAEFLRRTWRYSRLLNAYPPSG